MVKGSKRAGRVRDKWRDKQWIVVYPPTAFERKPLNYLPITDITQSKGRVIENTLFDILKQDPSQHQIKVFVQIQNISDGIGPTIFKGHEYTKELLRSLIRRGSSMINNIHDYTTMDGYTFRVGVVAFSQRRLNSSRKHDIRTIIHRLLEERIPRLTVDELVQEATNGKMNDSLLEEVKKIAPVRHIGIKKTKLITTPELRAVQEVKAVENIPQTQQEGEELA